MGVPSEKASDASQIILGQLEYLKWIDANDFYISTITNLKLAQVLLSELQLRIELEKERY